MHTIVHILFPVAIIASYYLIKYHIKIIAIRTRDPTRLDQVGLRLLTLAPLIVATIWILVVLHLEIIPILQRSDQLPKTGPLITLGETIYGMVGSAYIAIISVLLGAILYIKKPTKSREMLAKLLLVLGLMIFGLFSALGLTSLLLMLLLVLIEEFSLDRLIMLSVLLMALPLILIVMIWGPLGLLPVLVMGLLNLILLSVLDLFSSIVVFWVLASCIYFDFVDIQALGFEYPDNINSNYWPHYRLEKISGWGFLKFHGKYSRYFRVVSTYLGGYLFGGTGHSRAS